uniref:Uncharacterized protein n=1 Tax=Arundo donax TaxID=35708 RepID=A0A0A9DAG5_ARUDO
MFVRHIVRTSNKIDLLHTAFALAVPSFPFPHATNIPLYAPSEGFCDSIITSQQI